MENQEQIDLLARVTSDSFRDLEHGVATVTVMVDHMMARVRELECRIAELDGFESNAISNMH